MELKEITALGDSERKFLDLKTGKTIICKCPVILRGFPGNITGISGGFSDRNIKEIVYSDCLVHGR